jgi:hypothetical protein
VHSHGERRRRFALAPFALPAILKRMPTSFCFRLPMLLSLVAASACAPAAERPQADTAAMKSPSDTAVTAAKSGTGDPVRGLALAQMAGK